MKKWMMKAALFLGIMLCAIVPNAEVEAKSYDSIKNGIYAGDISLAGMTAAEAEAAINEYVASLQTAEITLTITDDTSVTITAGELGIRWANPEIVEEAMLLGTKGNIVQRYKALMDLEHENKIYPIELDFDVVAIDTILQEQCVPYNREAIDMSLVKEGDTFTVKEGQQGYALDVENSIDTVYEYLTTGWNRGTDEIALNVLVTEPRGTEEELLKVTDLLGSFTTSFASSNSNRSTNVTNGCGRIDGTTLYPGDEFSTHGTVSPLNAANGYFPAGSFVNGRVVDSYGGGICQVSTTLYNAVLLAELEVTQRNNHSMVVTYVDPAADAAIAESSGKDFKFVNNTEYPIYIEGYTTKDKKITFNIYGVETRDPNRTVEYVSEILETNVPTEEVIYTDSSKPIGYVDVTGAHIGYRAKLWKIVKEDGVEVSREVVNTSRYKMSPRSAVVGIATDDPNAYNEIMAAIGTNSINHVKNVVAILTAPPASNTAPAQ